jgi:hypothetical protein
VRGVPVLTISEVLAADTRPSWQESVALVQEIASQLTPGQPVPATDDLLLAEDGTLSFGFAGESSKSPVTDLGELLVALLTGSSAPPSLVDFAQENGRPEPAHSTLEGFCRALAFYERPNRRADVTAVAGRLAARAQVDRGRELVAQLRQRAAGPEIPEPKIVRQRPVARRVPVRQILMAAGLALIVLLGGALFRSGMLNGSTAATDPDALGAEALPNAVAVSEPAGSGGAASAPATAPSAATDHTTAPDAAPGSAPPSRGPAPVPPSRSDTATRQISAREPRSEPRAVSTLSSRLSATRSGPPTKAGASLRAQPEPRVDVAVVQPLPLPVPRGSASPMRAGQADMFGVRGGLSDGAPVYSREDPEVKPPRILRQQLPSVPAPNAQTGYLEFVVDTHGDVESLNLISPTTRFHDLMLVAAAKAWKFRPALFDGRPVKYRMRVAITLDGSS